MKILLAVLATDANPWDFLISNIKKTWGSVSVPDITIIYYYGDVEKAKSGPVLIGDSLYLNREETLDNIGKKTLDMFEYALEHFEFDFLVRPNASSYINTKILQEYLSNKPLNNFAGGIMAYHDNIKYLSGSCYVLSKDVVSAIVKHKEYWNHQYIDDVALGEILGALQFKFTGIPRIDIYHPDLAYIHNSIYNYRCKCDYNRLVDVVIFNELHSLFKEEDNTESKSQ